MNIWEMIIVMYLCQQVTVWQQVLPLLLFVGSKEATHCNTHPREIAMKTRSQLTNRKNRFSCNI